MESFIERTTRIRREITEYMSRNVAARAAADDAYAFAIADGYSDLVARAVADGAYYAVVKAAHASRLI